MRTAIGNTTIDENDNIGALLGQQQTQVEKNTANREEIPAVVGKMEKQEENIDDETDEDQPLVSNLSEYYVVDDTEEGDAEENDESEFHMVFKKMRLNR
jgi:hypothetical protein